MYYVYTVNRKLIYTVTGHYEKFSTDRQTEISRHLHTMTLLKTSGNYMCKNLETLIMYSKTNSTWQKHVAAWNTLTNFYEFSGQKETWPMDIYTARQFVVWALRERLLKPDTVKQYLSSIKLAHVLGEVDSVNFTQDSVIKMALTGAKNLNYLSNTVIRDRPPMTISSLKILGHELACTDWKTHSKQVTWTACLTSFFTSCRMGELLSEKTNSFDRNTILLWKHVNFWDDHVTIFVPYTKVKGLKGHMLEIFPSDIENCCPFSALMHLKNMAIECKIYNSETPVFSFESGKLLTVSKLNEILENLLKHLCKKELKYTCHSFRAAIPTIISNHPDKAYTADIKDWGEWDSPAYKLYAKNDFGRKKFLFRKVCNILNSV